MHSPRTFHLSATHHIVRQLKRSLEQGVFSCHGYLNIEGGFIGAYWAGLKSDGKSTGCSTLVGSNVIC